MAKPKRILKRKEEGVFTYLLSDGAERFAVRMESQGKDWRKFGFPTITKARHWRDTRKGRILEGRLFPEQEQVKNEEKGNAIPFFRDYANTWFAYCQTRGLKHSTLLRYEGLLRKHLLPAFGAFRLDHIKRVQVRELVTTLTQDGLTPKTIHNMTGVLSCIFNQADEDGLEVRNPGRNPSKLIQKSKGKKVAAFTFVEECSILDGAKSHVAPYYPFILFLFRTGTREGEAVALRPEDLGFQSRFACIQRNFTAGRLVDTPKGGKSRNVDLAQDLVEVLKDHLVLQEAETSLTGHSRPDLVFTSPEGNIIRSNNFRDRVWRPLLKQLGIPYRNVHAIRHTFATRMIMAGANIVYVQKQLGHSTIQLTVDTYTHWIEEAEQGRTLEVDRLTQRPKKDGVGTLVGTLAGLKT